MEPSLRKDWEQQVTGKFKRPTLSNFHDFVKDRLRHKAPTHTTPIYVPPKPASSSSLAAMPPPPRPSPSSYASRPASSPSLLPPPSADRSTRPRPPLTCAACAEHHLLIRCPTFTGFSVERRNKLVRDRRLCLNCFSDKHGCRSCPNKFSCRTCGLKHHTLLHRDREPAPASPTPTPTTAAAVSVDPDHGPIPPLLDTGFPNTIVVHLSNGPHSVKARAMLDSGAGASLMTEKLATSLGLKRYPQPMSLTCASGLIHSKFVVSTSLHTACKSFHTKPFNFIVVPQLISTTVPSNRDAILNSPALQDVTLADPDLGGDVDQFIGVRDIDDCVSKGPFKVD